MLIFAKNVGMLFEISSQCYYIKGKNMAKMSLCTISYTFEHYAGINVEKLSNGIYEYARKEFEGFHAKSPTVP